MLAATSMNQTLIYAREAALDVQEFRRALIASGTRSDPP